jgi:hypothetical protein
MATITLYAAEDMALTSNKAIGFFGNEGWNDPIEINDFNGRTFLVDADGSDPDFECDNCKRLATSTVILGQEGSGIPLRNMPNYLATLNIRFEHSVDVLVYNVKLYIHAVGNKNIDPVGLTFYTAEIRHPETTQDDSGEGDINWNNTHGNSAPQGLISSPGTQGLRPLGDNSQDTRHDWYVAMSCTPILPNNKQFALTVELEYLEV